MSLGLLVGSFGDFVRERNAAHYDTAPVETPFPPELSRLRAAFNHHLIPLALLSNADGDFADSEQEAILRHCLALARKAGTPASAAEEAALKDYIASFRPALSQLTPALHRIEQEPRETIAALLETASAVIDADGERREPEVRFLERMRGDLAAL